MDSQVACDKKLYKALSCNINELLEKNFILLFRYFLRAAIKTKKSQHLEKVDNQEKTDGS